MIAPVPGPLVNASSAIAVRNVNEITHVSTAPFGPLPATTRALGQLTHLSRNFYLSISIFLFRLVFNSLAVSLKSAGESK